MTPRRVLFVLARDPLAVRTGRTAVLETAVQSLVDAGHEVTVAAVASGDPGTWMGLPLHRVSPPGLAALPFRVVAGTARLHALNEAVLNGAGVRRAVAALAAEHRAEVVVGDGIRTWPAIAGLGLPTVMHLDDLLSDRYGSPSFRDGNDSVLGYYGDRLPGPARALGERVAHTALGVESRLMHRREIAVARACGVAAMTSRREAEVLSARAGAPVVDLPMAVDPRRPGVPSQAPAASFAFLGVLHYGPNLAALRHLRDVLLPAARTAGLEVEVTAYGEARDTVREEFAQAQDIRLAGYVDDLGDALRGHRGFLSPILSGAGVKTKVLDAMSVGLPVVATRLGVEGIPVTSGRDALVSDTPEGFVEHVRALQERPALADDIGRAGHELLSTVLSADRIRRAWHEAVEIAMDRGAGPARA